MITLFRRIRQKLIDSGSVTKYLLYAVGEILLVVIGILIALQVNNWNSQSKDHRISMEYHERMISDIDQMLETVESEIERADDISAWLSQAVLILERQEFSDSTNAILNLAMSNYFKLSPLSLQISSYEEMKSTGRLILIYNIDIRQRLNGYSNYASVIESITNEFAESVNGRNELFDNYVRIYVRANSTTVRDYDPVEISNNPTLINALSRFSDTWDSYKYFMDMMAIRMTDLQKVLQQELESL